MSAKEKTIISQLLRETIVHLCKTSSLYNGRVEIDGIICISGQTEGQELVVKVHETYGGGNEISPRSGYGNNSKFRIDNLLNSERDILFVADAKRRRIDYKRSYNNNDGSVGGIDFLRYTNTWDRSHGVTPFDEDYQNTVADLSMKNSSNSPQNNAEPMELRDDHSSTCPSPQLLEGAVEQKPGVARSLHPYYPRKLPFGLERWSPNKPLPSVPECKLCNCRFDNSEVLSEHNEAVHSVFTCLCCFKTFTSRSNLERHSRLHTGHKPYACSICGKAFSRKDHLSNHASKHAFRCSTCSKRFTDRSTLISHYYYDHDTMLTNICNFCNKGFSNQESFEEHLKVHPQYNNESYRDSFVKQLKNSSDPLQKLHCSKCRFETADKVTFVKHQIIHMDNKRCYTCLACAKVFDDPLKYSDHLLLHQNDSNIFECCICRQICSSLYSLRHHERTHVHDSTNASTDVDGQLFCCHKCGKSFPSMHILKEHMEMHESISDIYGASRQNKTGENSDPHRSNESALDFVQMKCSTCGEQFGSVRDFDQHLLAEGSACRLSKVQNNDHPMSIVDALSRKDKRKQKLPKLMLSSDRMEEESDVEVVEPQSPPGDEKESTNTGCDFVITDNPTQVVKVSGNNNIEIKLEPLRSIMNRAKTRENDYHGSPDKPFWTMASSEGQNSIHSSPGENSSNGGSVSKFESRQYNFDIPGGPYFCAVCQRESDTFQDLESHCMNEHSRSPCMFCSKTFAQKANRDRHVCLHTGDKPYSCPECDEKFSRGDKLKMHRIRSHGVQYPTYVARQKYPTPPPQDYSLSVSPGLSVSQDSTSSPMTNRKTDSEFKTPDKPLILASSTENLSLTWMSEPRNSSLDWSARPDSVPCDWLNIKQEPKDKESTSLHTTGEWTPVTAIQPTATLR